MTWRGDVAGLTLVRGMVLVLMSLALAGNAHRATAQTPLVADLSDDFIAITAGFSGSEVLLFGATEGEGNVIVIVRGPNSKLVVRRKEKILGIWANRAQATYSSMPSFYHLAASGPVTDLLTEEARRELEIGFDNLNLVADDAVDADDAAGFGAGLLRVQRARDLYTDRGMVEFIGGRLFRTQVAFPANVPPGDYTVLVYLVQDGEIVSNTKTPLQVRRAGFEAAMFEFAHEQSLSYGLIAILLALMAGWLAGFIFRRA